MKDRIDPFSADARADPYPVYQRLRESAPVYAVTPGRWVVTRHADVRSLLLDHRCAHWGHDPALGVMRSPPGQALAEAVRLFAPSRPRSALSRQMTAAINTGALDGVEQQLDSLCDNLLHNVADGRPCDALAEYAHPLTMLAVGAMLGLPTGQTCRLAEATAALRGSFFECLRGPGISPVPVGPARMLQTRVDELIDQAHAVTGASVIAQLRSMLETASGGDRRDRLFNALLVLIYATHHNMMNFIGNGLLALATQPQAQAQLRHTPTLIERAVLELLRCDSPLQYIVLVARESFELHGHVVARADEIMACVGSANRDEAVFDDPDRLDFTRSNAQDLLSLGTGPWRCMGARLAVRIGAVAFAKIVERGFALAPNAPRLQWMRQPIVQRGLCALPLVMQHHE